MRTGPMNDIGNAYAAAGFMWERALANIIERNPTELWEWLYGRVLSEPDNPKVVRPGEQCMDAGKCPICDGRGYVQGRHDELGTACKPCGGTGRILLYMTPDGYHIDDMIMEEWKWTTKSCNPEKNPITGPKFRRWISFQIPSYLKALNLDTCRLRVFYARGDYTTGAPQWREYLIKYTQLELDETWDCVANHAQLMYQEGIVK